MSIRMLCYLFTLCAAVVLFFSPVWSQNRTSRAASQSEQIIATEAVMCEGVENSLPRNPAVVFSSSIGRVFCLTTLENVKERTFVYHNWYYRDELSTRIRLALKPPRWSVASSIQLRETDIGPWRVEVSGPEGRVLHVLRFSVTN